MKKYSLQTEKQKYQPDFVDNNNKIIKICCNKYIINHRTLSCG